MAAQTEAATEAARADMRIANQYIEQFLNTKPDRRTHEPLTFALRYINQARQKDPNATLMVNIGDEVCIDTLDMMEARVYFHEAISRKASCVFSMSRSAGEEIISLLKTSIELEPRSPIRYVALAETYDKLYDHNQALAVLQEALQKFPEDFDVRSAYDHIEANPKIKPPKPPDPRGTVLRIGFGLLLLSIATMTIGDMTHLTSDPTFGGSIIFFGSSGFLIAIAIIWFGFRMSRPLPTVE